MVGPIWLPVFSYFFYNEPELGVGIDPGMALTPLPSSIGRGMNPRPSDREPSALPLDHGFCPLLQTMNKVSPNPTLPNLVIILYPNPT
jgi:hypothetical protein